MGTARGCHHAQTAYLRRETQHKCCRPLKTTVMCRRRNSIFFLGICCLNFGSFWAGFTVCFNNTTSLQLPVGLAPSRDLKPNSVSDGSQLDSEPPHPDKNMKGLVASFYNTTSLQPLGATPSRALKPNRLVYGSQRDKKSNDFIQPVNQTWMAAKTYEGPGIYRACVPRPKGNDQAVRKVVTGGLVEQSADMTVAYCLQRCGNLNLTYAALSRATECFCSDVNGESPLLTYVDGSNCDVPCSGEPKYNCGGNEFMTLYRTSALDERCSDVQLKPRHTFPLMALASFPRSGNTWTRQLLTQATGLLTSTVYPTEPMVLPQRIFKGKNWDIAWGKGQTICTKTHLYSAEHILLFEGAVLLIRNPYKAVVADIFRRKMNWQKIVADVSKKIYSSAWTMYVAEQFETWRNLTMNWIRYARRIHVTHYDNLQDDPLAEITEIVRFLNATIVDKERIMCATQEAPSSKATGVRLGIFGTQTRKYFTLDLRLFTDEMQSVIDGYIEEVNATLKEHHLPPIPNYYSVTTL